MESTLLQDLSPEATGANSPMIEYTAYASTEGPPYEADIDIRILLHFSTEVSSMIWTPRNIVEQQKCHNLSDQARIHFQSHGMEAGELRVCRVLCHEVGNPRVSWDAILDDDPRRSPLFWAIDGYEDEIKNWSRVHFEIRRTIMEAYTDSPAFAIDPPIRYFLDTFVPWTTLMD